MILLVNLNPASPKFDSTVVEFRGGVEFAQSAKYIKFT